MHNHSEPNLRRAQIPDGTRVYAIGDIHGQLDMFERMVVRIASDASHLADGCVTLIFLGDYIDRGPDSAGVISYLINELPKGFRTRFLRGNHEQALLNFLKDPDTFPKWGINGANDTLMSYGVKNADPEDGTSVFAAVRDELVSRMPQTHSAFYSETEFYVEMGGYVFAHAGIRPGVAMPQQSERDLLWIRHDFLDFDGDLGCVVVHGHTPQPDPVIRSNRIGIDTGAFAFGCLTAVCLEGTSHRFLQVRDSDL